MIMVPPRASIDSRLSRLENVKSQWQTSKLTILEWVEVENAMWSGHGCRNLREREEGKECPANVEARVFYRGVPRQGNPGYKLITLIIRALLTS